MKNLAELLKDCPKGMELDCLCFDNVTFDYVDTNRNRIYCKIDNRDIVWFTAGGCINLAPNAKCVIFPKGKTTWDDFVPPCKFKDGDIITVAEDSNPFIFHYDNGEFYDVHLALMNDNLVIYKRKNNWVSNLREFRYATEEEKQKLFDVIKANGYKWNAETKKLEKLIEPKFKVGDRIKEGKTIATVVRVCKDFYDIRLDSGIGSFTIDLQDKWELIPNKFDINTLKPFDKVLVRDKDIQGWCISFFSHCNGLETYKYSCINGSGYAQCIPYEKNEQLLGTTNDCDDYYKTWEK